MRAKGHQAALFELGEEAEGGAEPEGGRFDTVRAEEGAAFGRALLAKLRGEALTEDARACLEELRRSPEPVELERPRDPSWDRRAPRPVIDSSETLLVLDRGRDSEVRVSWRRYRGSAPFLDLRRWERSGRAGMQPTKQGVTIRLRELPRLLRVVVAAAGRARDAST